MKSRFFYGVFVGFILGCLFFFGVMNVNAQTLKAHEYEASYVDYYYDGGNRAETDQKLYAYDGRSGLYKNYGWDKDRRAAEYTYIG